MTASFPTRRRSRRPVKRVWSPMNNLMDRAVQRHQLAPQLTAAAICQAAEGVSAGRWRTISFRQGRLKLAVADYDTVAALQVQTPHLLLQINQAVGADAVKKLSFLVTSFDAPA